jgi:hypothetical protein
MSVSGSRERRVVDTVFERVVVTLSVPPALEERVIDWLLARADVATFTSGVGYRYGAESRALSIAEQVSGRQRRAEVTLEVLAEAVESWLRDLATDFPGTEVGYRVTPVLRSGYLRSFSG